MHQPPDASASEIFIQLMFLHQPAKVTALHIRQANQWPDFAIIDGLLVVDRKPPINKRLLKMKRANFATGVDEPWLAIIIVRHAPLTAVGRCGFFDDVGSFDTEAI